MHRLFKDSGALSAVLASALVWAGIVLGGCNGQGFEGFWVRPADPNTVKVPYPISLTLPKSIHIHPFTGTRTFDKEGGVRGIEVRVTPKDAWGDPTKAFGTFRFELYEYRSDDTRSRSSRKAYWNVSVADPRTNRVHWDVSLAYKFRLRWDQGIPVGRRFVLVTTFTSPYTERLFAERQFVAGE